MQGWECKVSEFKEECARWKEEMENVLWRREPGMKREGNIL